MIHMALTYACSLVLSTMSTECFLGNIVSPILKTEWLDSNNDIVKTTFYDEYENNFRVCNWHGAPRPVLCDSFKKEGTVYTENKGLKSISNVGSRLITIHVDNGNAQYAEQLIDNGHSRLIYSLTTEFFRNIPLPSVNIDSVQLKYKYSMDRKLIHIETVTKGRASQIRKFSYHKNEIYYESRSLPDKKIFDRMKFIVNKDDRVIKQYILFSRRKQQFHSARYFY